MCVFVFEPIHSNPNATGGACVLRTFADVGAFILIAVNPPRRLSPHWNTVRADLVQARFGARRAEVHQAMRDALAAEGWLAGCDERSGPKRGRCADELSENDVNQGSKMPPIGKTST
jgi:hypothetical protein